MNSDTEMMESQERNLPYEQPSLKKYGTMKEMTLSAGGSNGDAFGRTRGPAGFNFNSDNTGGQSGDADSTVTSNAGNDPTSQSDLAD